MESPFSITVSSDSVPIQTGRGETTLTVTNISGRALKGRAEILPGKPEAASWLTVTRGPERAFSKGAVEQFVVQVNVPKGSAEGDYTFRLRVADVADPNDSVTIGPTVGFKVAGSAPPPPPPSRLWIFILIGVVLLLVVGGIIFWAVNRGGPPPVAGVEVPDLTNKTVGEAKTILAGLGLALGDINRKVDFKPPDIILQQKPAAKETANKGDAVAVVATHESLVPVPQLNGRTEEQAKKLLAGLLDIERVEKSCRAGGAANTIYETVPRPDDQVARTTRLLIRVREDCVAVPGVVGADKATAFTRLNQVGLLGNPVAGSVNASRVNFVEDQTPRPNELIAKGGTVTLRFFRSPTLFDRREFDNELILQKKLGTIRPQLQ